MFQHFSNFREFGSCLAHLIYGSIMKENKVTPGFIYEWTDNKTGLKYIGRHQGTIDDGYVASSPLFMEQYKIRQTDFTRKILWYEEIVTSEKIVEMEEFYLSQIKSDEFYYRENRRYYNVSKISHGYTSENNPMHHQEIVNRMMETFKKRYGKKKTAWDYTVEKYGLEKATEMSREHLNKSDRSKAGHIGGSKPKSAEHRRKISETVKRLYASGMYKSVYKNTGKCVGRKMAMDPHELIKLVKEKGKKIVAKELGIKVNSLDCRLIRARKKIESGDMPKLVDGSDFFKY